MSFYTTSYNYDTVGNVKEVFDRDSNGVTTQNRYDYDALDRLTAWTMNNVGQEIYTYNAIGNLMSKTGVGSYDYNVNATNDWGCGGKPHSPKRAGSLGYCYDANGNMEWRYEVSKLYKQTWNADNKIASIQEKSTADWATNIGSAISFSYDADGARVKSVTNGVATIYIGSSFEKNVNTGQVTKYYSFNGQRVAMRGADPCARADVDSNGVINVTDVSAIGGRMGQTGPPGWTRADVNSDGLVNILDVSVVGTCWSRTVTNGTLSYLHSDHLGSASLATDSNGVPVFNSAQRYKPFGEVRVAGSGLPSQYTFTGQRSFMDFGLVDYGGGTRMYSPILGRFISADTVVPGAGNPQALNRYSYVKNSPLNYTDPSGHDPLDAQWHIDFFRANGRLPGEDDYRARLFSLLFKGSGDNGAWTKEDWTFYNGHRDGLWAATTQWENSNGAEDPRFNSSAGFESFAGHVEKLATYYEDGEEAQFVGALGTLYADIPYNADRVAGPIKAASRAHSGRLRTLHEGAVGTEMNGWNPSFIDARTPGDDQTHHYSAYVYTGYYYGSLVGGTLADIEDFSPLNVADIRLGVIGSTQGEHLASGKLTISNFASALRTSLGGP